MKYTNCFEKPRKCHRIQKYTVKSDNPIRKEGNPTKSSEVNEFIKKVMKCEVRKEGAKSHARRPIEYDEFINVLDLVRGNIGLKLRKYLLCSVLTMQWHLIARIDDMMKLKFENIQVGENNFTLICKMRWSKNITEERDAPEQIILGSMDFRICPLLNLAIYLEVTGRESGGISNDFVYGNPNDGHRVARGCLKDAFESDGFKKVRQGNLGTHSIRKGSATYASRCGQSKDFVNRRGRWRVDVYIDTTLPYPDACTAAVLCGPLGACKYRIRAHFQIVESFLIENVAISISKFLGNQIGAVLAVPLLWAVYENATIVPKNICVDIKSACARAGFEFGDLNPVERISIHPTGYGAEMNLIELSEEANAHAGGERMNQRNDIAMISQQMNLQRRLEEMNSNLMTEIAKMKSDLHRRFDCINTSIKRIAVQPVVRSSALVTSSSDNPNNNTTVAISTNSTKLSKCPRDLYALWHEYEFGLGGSKPAKSFTASERGANKFSFSRRKIFWDLVSEMVRKGYTSDAAIDKIYLVYGRSLSVSKILLKLRADRPTGGHPDLK
jgi:Transcriptional activator of glycolytic enzymes